MLGHRLKQTFLVLDMLLSLSVGEGTWNQREETVDGGNWLCLVMQAYI